MEVHQSLLGEVPMRMLRAVMMLALLFGAGVHAVHASSDADGDGLSDAWEWSVGLNALSFDSDGDGYGDGVELRSGYDPLSMTPAPLPQAFRERDQDSDGVTDFEELRLGFDPLAEDTDGDGFGDGHELVRGYDPRDPRPTKLEKRIEIDTSEQRLRSFLGPYELRVALVSTGTARRPTPKGTFRIASKHPRAWSPVAKLWMPWWMNFVGPGAPASRYGIHELPEWPNGKKEGGAHLGTSASGGCVRLGEGAAQALYDWAEVGTAVVVR